MFHQSVKGSGLNALVRMFIRDLINIPEAYNHISSKRTFSKSPLLRYNVLANEDFAMKEQKRILEITDFQLRLFINC